MGPNRLRATIVVCALLGTCVHAGQFTFSSHVASGSGSANVFDGGPRRFDADATFGPTDPRMSFIANDGTGSGSYDAFATAFGQSWIVQQGGEMRILVDFDTTYSPSLFPGGDRPGGTAEGQLSSVIEFPLPADDIFWAYQLLIRDTVDFEGTSLVVVENVTRSQTLLELTSEVSAVETRLTGQAGDIIRITSEMSGSGSAAPGVSTSRRYDADLDMVFIIPEPGSLLVLLAALPLLRKKFKP